LTRSLPDRRLSFLQHEERAEKLASHPLPLLVSNRDRLLETGIMPKAI
jgi:hypothetical protein